MKAVSRGLSSIERAAKRLWASAPKEESLSIDAQFLFPTSNMSEGFFFFCRLCFYKSTEGTAST